jgi:BTB/POZ domain
MYHQSIDQPDEKLLPLLEAAEYFQIAGLKEVCSRLLIETISMENCLELLNTTYKYDLQQLMKLAFDQLCLNRQAFRSRIDFLLLGYLLSLLFYTS